MNYIFNLSTKFDLSEKAISSESKFIMLNLNECATGCIVDEVTDIVKLNDEQVQSVPNFLSASGNNYITGIGKLEDRMIIILNPEKLFAKEYDNLQDAISN